MFLFRDLVSPRAWLAMVHHLTGAFIGLLVVAFFVIGVVLGFGLLPLALLGLPILGVTLRLAGWFGRAERARFGFMLGVRIPAWLAGTGAGFRWGVIPHWRMLGERATWAVVGYALLRPVVSVVALAVSVAAWAVGLTMVTLPAYDSLLPAGGADLGGMVIRGVPLLLVSVAGGIGLLLAAPQLAWGSWWRTWR